MKMHLSYTFDDLVNIINEDSGIETNVAIKTESDTSKEFLNEFEPMADFSSSPASSDNSDNTSTFGDFLSNHFFGDIYDELELGNDYDSLFADTVFEEGNSSQLVNKDCMWGGFCNEHLKPGRGDVDCPCDKSVAKLINGIIIGKPDIFMSQSVLRPHLRNAGVPVIDMLTPNVPIFESEEDRSRINSAKLANKFSLQSLREEERALHHFNRLKSVNSEDDEDESEEEEDDDESEEEEETPQQVLQYAGSNIDMCEFNRLRTLHATLNDHSYYHRREKSTYLSELGIETPSDSEEEIDVVSVSDKKYPVGTRLAFIPPTNPPNGARCNIQRYNQNNNNNNSTINNNNFNGRNNNNGLKAKMPAKRGRTTPTKNYPPAKRKAVAAPANENKPTRARQTRTNNSSGRRRKNYRDNDSENDQHPLEKRSLHNDMERQRRVGLRNDFENLRRLVPNVSNNEKAPKVSILREARKYCKKLQKTSEDMDDQLEKLHEYQAHLQMKLSRLRRQQALENKTISSEDCEEFDQY